MSDYIKELEQQNEQLNKKLADSQLTIEVLQTIDKNRQSDIKQMASRLCELKEECKMMKYNYEHACSIVADMHKAAVGKICAPRKGVVEDVAKLRSMYLKLKEKKHDKRINRPIRKTTGRTHRVPPKAAR